MWVLLLRQPLFLAIDVWWFHLGFSATRLWLFPPVFLQVWVMRPVGLTVSDERVVKFPLPCCYLLSQEAVRGAACLGVLTLFHAYILVCGRTFAFWAEFFVVWVMLSLKASSHLFLGVCDPILRALSYHTCIGWIAPGWSELPRVRFLSEHILIQPQLKILMR